MNSRIKNFAACLLVICCLSLTALADGEIQTVPAPAPPPSSTQSSTTMTDSTTTDQSAMDWLLSLLLSSK